MPPEQVEGKMKECMGHAACPEWSLVARLMQAEALRGDPEGFARQQVMLDDASQLVALAQAKVAELEANTPSLQQVLLLCCT